VAAWTQGSQDFGTTFPNWAQLSAVALLIVGMAWTLRAIVKRFDATTVDMAAQRDAAIADLRAQRDKAYAARDETQDDLEGLNRELRTSVVPAMVEVNKTMLRVIALLDERR